MGEAKRKKRKKEEMKKSYPENNRYYRIYKNDKILYRDESGNFREINNYYFEKEETIFTKTRILVASVLIFIYWGIVSYIYSLIYELSFLESLFAFGDNYIFLGGVTLIIFFAFKRKKGYNKDKDKE